MGDSGPKGTRLSVSKGVVASLLTWARFLQEEMPSAYVAGAIADYNCETVFARARTREQAFGLGQAVGYIQAVSEVSGIGIELLICTVLNAEDARRRAAVLNEIAEMARGWDK